jgi:hypothetical protein
MRWLAVVALCAGCYDFSVFDHLPDAAGISDAAMAADAEGPPDCEPVDLGGLNVLMSDDFDGPAIDPALWGPVDLTGRSLDPTIKRCGASSLRIDPTGAALSWRGPIPTARSSLHLRYFLRYEGTPTTGSINNGSLVSATDGLNAALTSNPAQMALNIYGGTNRFDRTGSDFPEATWLCVELVFEYDGTSKWAARLRTADGTSNTPSVTTGFSTMPTNIAIGATPKNGVTAWWIDSVVLTKGNAVIGCR